MTDRELFEKLKRDREFWHVPDDNIDNPDFSTPDGFFWLWERVWEKRMFKAFLGECEISELDPHMSPETAVPILFKHIVHPTRFTEALKQYLDK